MDKKQVARINLLAVQSFIGTMKGLTDQLEMSPEIQRIWDAYAELISAIDAARAANKPDTCADEPMCRCARGAQENEELMCAMRHASLAGLLDIATNLDTRTYVWDLVSPSDDLVKEQLRAQRIVRKAYALLHAHYLSNQMSH